MARTVKIDRDVGEIVSVALAEVREKLPEWVQPYSLAVEQVVVTGDIIESDLRVLFGIAIVRYRRIANISDMVFRLKINIRYFCRLGEWITHFTTCEWLKEVPPIDTPVLDPELVALIEAESPVVDETGGGAR